MAIIVAAPNGAPGAIALVNQPQAVPSAGVPIGAVVVVSGPQGPATTASDYGFVRYDEVNSTPINLVENVQQPFRFLAPLTTSDTLRPPFAGLAFLAPDNTTLRARKAGDSMLVRVRLSVVTARAGGTFQCNLFVTGNTTTLQGSNSTRSVNLAAPAGTSERVDLFYQLFPGSGFVANGALFQMQSTVPTQVTPESLFVTPVVAAP